MPFARAALLPAIAQLLALFQTASSPAAPVPPTPPATPIAAVAGAPGAATPDWLAPLARLDPAVLAAVALAALVLALLTLLFATTTWVRARRMDRHYGTLMRGVEGQSLTRAVESYVERLNAVERRSSQVGDHGRATSTRLNQAVQHIRLERYSAVDASDNQQSFSLALLDGADNGIVLTALYTRSGLRVYAKPIEGGRSTYALSADELRAIARDVGD